MSSIIVVIVNNLKETKTYMKSSLLCRNVSAKDLVIKMATSMKVKEIRNIAYNRDVISVNI